ncbi:lyase family protein [Macrococcus capreoli]|uniref:lyase family protein n=1 Tax=Macrococcus capreoli TaxID=2982690 RepID=UPI003EE5D23F
MNYEVYFLSSDPYKYDFINNFQFNHIYINTNDFTILKEYIKNIENVKAIYTTSDYFVSMANKLSIYFNLVSNKQESIDICRNKYLLSKKLSDLAPESYLVSELNIGSLNKKEYILKPLSGSGSMEVSRFSKEKLSEEIDKLKDKSNYLVQDYIDGLEYSVETLTINGIHHHISIVKKTLFDETNFVESGHQIPCQLEEDVQNKIKDIIRSALNKIEYFNGFSHTEIRIQNNKVFIIEINPRLAGGMIPILINKCLDIDLIELSLEYITDNLSNVNKLLNNIKLNNYGVIRFKEIPKEGILTNIIEPQKTYQNSLLVKLKKDGDQVFFNSDFSDRILCVIVWSNDILYSTKIASKILEDTTINVKDNINTKLDLENTGRLKSSLHKALTKQINLKKIKHDELPIIVDIEVSHILMLYKHNLISRDTTIKLLKEIDSISVNDYKVIRELLMDRGIYLSFESYMISKLGYEVAGNLQLAKSRNDINATVAALYSKKSTLKICDTLTKTISTLTTKSLLFKESPMPIYSQYQTGLPSNVAHYLLGITEGLLESLENLLYLLDNLKSPLGSGAGAGTSIEIDSKQSSKYLGFNHFYHNSINAVSNRNAIIRINNECAIIATTISRVCQDLQVWSMQEINVCKFPDFIAGGSSAMPQKKNPYILEWMKSKADVIINIKDINLTSKLKTPLSNSYEVSSLTLPNLTDIVNHTISLINVFDIVITYTEFIRDNSIDILEQLSIYSSDIAEYLFLNHKVPFRKSHHYLGSLVHDGSNNLEELLYKTNNYFDSAITSEEIRNYNRSFGMGPGSINHQITIYKDNLDQLKEKKKYLYSDFSLSRKERKIISESIIQEGLNK